MLKIPVGSAELRALEPYCAEEFAAYVEENRSDLIEWLPWADSIRETETARKFLERFGEGAAPDGRRIYGLWRDGQLVGGTMFGAFDARQGTCEIGVWLSRDARGHGLVSRAVREMIDWAIDLRGLRRIEWRCVPENAASKATAVRLGFTHEGTLRSAFNYRGRDWDIEVWSLLADDRRQ